MHASAGLTTVIHEVRPYLGEGVRGRLTMPADRLCAVVADPAPVGTDPWWREVARLGTPLRVPGPGGTDLTLFLHRSADAAACRESIPNPGRQGWARCGLVRGYLG